MSWPDPEHAWLVATTEVRRGWRKTRQRGGLQLAALGVAALFGVAVTAVGAVGAYAAGRAVAGGSVAEPLAAGALVAAGLWTMVFLLSAYLTALQFATVEDLDALLTTVPHRDVVGGLLLAGFARVGGIALPPLLVAGAAFALGAGAAATLPAAFLGVASVVCSAYAAGYAVGLGARYLLGRSAFVARHKTALGVLAFLLYVGLLVTNTFGALLLPLVEAVQASPVGWYGDLVLASLVADATLPRGLLVVATSAALALGAVRASVRVAAALWYADPVEGDGGPAGTADTATTGRLAARLGRPTAWVVRKSWLRARRGPMKLVYVAYPLFLLFSPVQAAVEAGHVTASLPATLVLYGAWATGAAFTLNPLGDEGDVLPVTLTANVGGRSFVGGLVAAGALPGVPVTALLGFAAALASPLSAVAAVATAVAGAVLPAGAAAVATGIGTAFPKFEATSVTRSRSVVVPSVWAFAVYSTVVVLLGAPATAAQVPAVSTAVGGALDVSPTAVQVGGLLLTLLGVAAAGALSARHAVGRFDRYTL